MVKVEDGSVSPASVLTVSEHRDHTLPEGKWVFDKGVADVFDEMLVRSIPGYAMMRWSTKAMAGPVVKNASYALDLGSSRGDAVAKMIAENPGVQFTLNEISPPMVSVLRERFENTSNVRISTDDLKDHGCPIFKPDHYDLVIANLTMIFIPIEYRQQVFHQIYNSLAPGGMFLMVEKILGESALTQKKLVDTYLKMKADNGYSQEEITRKRLSLEGVLVPMTNSWNTDQLNRAGFTEIDTYFRCLNFCGTFAMKP